MRNHLLPVKGLQDLDVRVRQLLEPPLLADPPGLSACAGLGRPQQREVQAAPVHHLDHFLRDLSRPRVEGGQAPEPVDVLGVRVLIERLRTQSPQLLDRLFSCRRREAVHVTGSTERREDLHRPLLKPSLEGQGPPRLYDVLEGADRDRAGLHACSAGGAGEELVVGEYPGLEDVPRPAPPRLPKLDPELLDHHPRRERSSGGERRTDGLAPAAVGAGVEPHPLVPAQLRNFPEAHPDLGRLVELLELEGRARNHGEPRCGVRESSVEDGHDRVEEVGEGEGCDEPEGHQRVRPPHPAVQLGHRLTRRSQVGEGNRNGVADERVTRPRDPGDVEPDTLEEVTGDADVKEAVQVGVVLDPVPEPPDASVVPPQRHQKAVEKEEPEEVERRLEGQVEGALEELSSEPLEEVEVDGHQHGPYEEREDAVAQAQVHQPRSHLPEDPPLGYRVPHDVPEPAHRVPGDGPEGLESVLGELQVKSVEEDRSERYQNEVHHQLGTVREQREVLPSRELAHAMIG